MQDNTHEAEKSLVGSLNQIGRVIGVMSGKGGVGKSTVSALLALQLAHAGLRIGILDADITGPSIPRAFGVTGRDCQGQGSQFGILPAVTATGIKIMSINLFLPHEDDPVIWRGPLIGGAVKQFWEETFWGDLDYLVVDLPPGTGDVALTVMQSLPLNGLVVVTTPQTLSLMVVKKSIKMAEKMEVPLLGLVENMSLVSCPHCGEAINLFGHGEAEEVAGEAGLPLLARLPWDTSLNAHMDNGTIEKALSPALAAEMEELLQAVTAE